jgi:predicted O-methyltransferase YrrM
MQSLEGLWGELSLEPGFYPYSSEPEVAKFLAALVELIGAREVLELGAHVGATTLWLCGAAERTGGRVTAVDIRDRIDARVRARFRNLRAIQSDSLAALDQFSSDGERFDLVFVDDVHTFEHVSAVMARLRPVTNLGGLWAYHDAISFPDVARAIERFVGSCGSERLLLSTPHTVGRAIRAGRPSGLAVLRPS